MFPGYLARMSIAELDLLDWKRKVFALYADVRAASEPRAAWVEWRSAKDSMFANHPQSPIPESERVSFRGLSYFDYEPSARVHGTVLEAPRETLTIATSGEHPYEFTRVARVSFELRSTHCELDLYWLENYGGGIFLPFRDSTAGRETYGAGRYLLDTVKGADLGTTEDGQLALDFNFAFNPSCAYDARWVCPLAPPANRLDLEITAGERV